MFIKRLISSVLVISILSSFSFISFADDKADELKEASDAAQAESDAADALVEELENTITYIEGQVSSLTNSINETESQIQTLVLEIYEQESEIEQKESEINAKEEDINSRWAAFKASAVLMQQINDSGSLYLLLSSEDMYQYLTFSTALSDLSSYNQTAMDALNEEMDLLEIEKEELEAAKASLEDSQSELESIEASLSNQLMSADSQLTQAEADAAAAEAIAKEKADAANAALDAYDSYIKSLISNSSGDTSVMWDGNGQFILPIASYTYISTYFGEMNGFGTSIHKGLDFAAPAWTNIYAAGSGEVITSGYSSSYGYYVIIYHGYDENGDNYSTVYAHMVQMPSVSVGDYVTTGQVIGYVGTTGSSTGNHLHFEVRKNGERVDPMDYL